MPLEQFEMAEWCTQKDQAVLACKYMLALRKHVTHSVTFKTTPQDGLCTLNLVTTFKFARAIRLLIHGLAVE